ncbi:hypothetical protein Tco_0475252 [Tanacetum coccineum]
MVVGGRRITLFMVHVMRKKDTSNSRWGGGSNQKTELGGSGGWSGDARGGNRGGGSWGQKNSVNKDADIGG